MADEILDVLVIGGGVSGLTAAHEILKADSTVNLCLLEAKGRLGGRTLTVKVDIGNGKLESFDLGGQWVAPSQPDVMEMLEELGLETYPQYIQGTKVMQVGSENVIRTYTSDIPSLGSYWGVIELQLFIWKVERMAREIPIEDPYKSEFASLYDATTMDTFVRDGLRTQAARDTIQAACRSVLGCDLDRVSVLFFLAYANSSGGVMKLLMAKENGAQELRVKGGTQQISEILADRVGREKIHLNQPITSVCQESGIVTVQTVSGKLFRAKHVVVTIPPHCVARVQFSPPLSKNRQLLMENMPVGHLSKFVVTYEKAYWREAGYSGEIVSNGGDPLLSCSTGPLSIVYDATTNNAVPALVGFIAGKPGIEWHNQTLEERRASILSCLSDCFGKWALTPTSYTEKIWTEEEYNGGCPVNFGVPGILFTFRALCQPHGLVHWAGTETSTHWAGYLSGAVQSGRRAACEVMKIRGVDMSKLEKLVTRKPYADIAVPYSLPNLLTPLITFIAIGIAFIAVYFL